jgi:hypothetical protein
MIPRAIIVSYKSGERKFQISKTRKARLKRLQILQEIEMRAGQTQVPQPGTNSWKIGGTSGTLRAVEVLGGVAASGEV